MYYYNARYYDPDLCRFIQADSKLDGLNRYTYCHNNPIKYTDPTGKDAERFIQRAELLWDYLVEHWNALNDLGKRDGNPVKFTKDYVTRTARLWRSLLKGKDSEITVNEGDDGGGTDSGTGDEGSGDGDDTGDDGGSDGGDGTVGGGGDGNDGNNGSQSDGSGDDKSDDGDIDQAQKVTSPNQMQQQVLRGQAPKTVDHVDGANENRRQEQPHVHFKDGRVRNQDGTPSHGSEDGGTSKKEQDWLDKNGWE